jgi:hypothetical protein
MNRFCKNMFFTCFTVFCLAFGETFASTGNYPNSDNHAKLLVPVSEGKMLIILEKQAPQGLFPNDTKLKFIGTIHNKHVSYNVVFTSLIWGDAHRETSRIVIFSSDWQYLGNYGEIYSPPTEIRGGILYWPYSSELGNKIELTGLFPPKKIVLNGEIYYFDTEKRHK